MTDEDLLRRQGLLQAEAAELIAGLGLVDLLGGVGPVELTGSYVSGLMTWPEIDVMVLAGPEFEPGDVLALMRRIVELPGVTGLEYQDERAERCPTDAVRDERYHVGITAGLWRVDLSIWLHDLHSNVTAWHETLGKTITPQQRDAVLRIKDVLCRQPGYPGGLPIYTAVVDHGVRTAGEFQAWLTQH